VTKKEIIKQIATELNLSQTMAKKAVQRTLDLISDTIVQEGRIELRNFGIFEVKKRARRMARNPKTGDRVEVPERLAITFKPGKELQERVQKIRASVGPSATQPIPASQPETETAGSTVSS
jgi:integration host factor subunit beta